MLAIELWWRGLAPCIDLPPKRPPPGHDRAKLEERAAGLQAWASVVLEAPAALNVSSVRAFFDLDASRDTDALLRLQKFARGYLARRIMPRNTIAPQRATHPVARMMPSPQHLRAAVPAQDLRPKNLGLVMLGLGIVCVILSAFPMHNQAAADAAADAKLRLYKSSISTSMATTSQAIGVHYTAAGSLMARAAVAMASQTAAKKMPLSVMNKSEPSLATLPLLTASATPTKTTGLPMLQMRMRAVVLGLPKLAWATITFPWVWPIRVFQLLQRQSPAKRHPKATST